MDELTSRLVANHGLDEAAARRAIAIVMAFLRDAAPPEKVAELRARLPEQTLPDLPEPGSFNGMMGALAAFNALQAAGLDMTQIQGATREIAAYAKEHAGAPLVDDMISSIPGLGKFV